LTLPQTTWRITGFTDWPNTVSIELTVDTDAPGVLTAIENAAANYGIQLERVGAGDSET
jgi:hypothetical protein